MSARLGQTVVIDNRPGGGTTIGTKAVASADPDGHTLLVTTSNVLVLTQLNNNVDFVTADFAPVATVATTSWIMVIKPAIPAQSLKEFIAYAGRNPGKVNFGFGQGTGPHLVGELFKKLTGTNIVSIPYKGGAQAVTDMLGGHIDMNLTTVSTSLHLIRENKLRALAVTSPVRDRDLPDVPTMIESGLPNLTLGSTLGIVAPARTPQPIVKMLNGIINEILASSELRNQMSRVGYEPKLGTPQDFASFLVEEERAWVPIAKEIGFRLN